MTLLDTHRQHLRGSGLSDETIAAAGIYSVEDPAASARILNWEGNDGPAPAIAFPVCGRDGSLVATILRPDEPVRRKDGRTPKYEWAKSTSGRLYFAPAPLVDPVKWGDPATPLVFTEGVKKALSCAQTGMPAIGASGVSMWHDTQASKGGHRRDLHPDLAGTPLKGRRAFIAFDGGDTTENPLVILEESRLCRMLLDAGADVLLLRFPFKPGGPKVGLDDFLAALPESERLAALEKLCAEALQGDPLARVRLLEKAEDKSIATLALMRDRSFLAAIHVADAAVRDLLNEALRHKAKLKRTTVENAVQGFVAELRTPPKEPTPEEIAAAEAAAEAEAERTVRLEINADGLLADPRLLDRFYADLEADGLVGERAAAETLLLVVTTRKTTRPVHAVIKAASSSGKNFTLGLVLARLPQAEVKFISDMSSRALLYMATSIKGMVLAIAEQEGAEKADYTIRTAQSEGSLTVLVAEKVADGPVTTREHTVEGPACFITTTTRAKLHDENETRLLEITLDETPEQTARINVAQALRAAHPPTADERAKAAERTGVWRCALGKLELTEVLNPHAPAHAARFPTTKIRARRDFQRVLDLAGARALLFQKQRKVLEGRVVVSDEDMTAAVKLCEALHSPIPPRLRSVLDRLRASVLAAVEFSPAEAAKILGYDPDAARRLLRDAAKLDLVEETEAARGRKPSKFKLCHPPAAPTDSPTSSDNPGRSDKSPRDPMGSALSDCLAPETPPADRADAQGPLGDGDRVPAKGHDSAGRTIGQRTTLGNDLENCPTGPAVGQQRTIGQSGAPLEEGTL